MTYITFLVAIVCSNPIMHEKFKVVDTDTTGIKLMRCEKALHECYQASRDIKYCINDLREM